MDSFFKYYRRHDTAAETVEYLIYKDNELSDTCSINVESLLCGRTSFPCASGDDLKFSGTLIVDLLEFLRKSRAEFTEGLSLKTCDLWHFSGLNFDEFCFPGDIVDDELVNFFTDCVPPISLRLSCTQCGEAYSTAKDDAGNFKQTYTTFHKIGDNRWRYDGHCFAGENVNRDTKKPRLERLLGSIQNPKRLRYLGKDSWGRYVYEDENKRIWKHLDCLSSREDCIRRGDKLISSSGNDFDGEPDCPMLDGIYVEFEEVETE